MKPPVKVAGFVVGLAAVFGATVAVGNAVGPIGEPSTAPHDSGGHSVASDDPGASGGTGRDTNSTPASTGAEAIPGGLMVSQNGYTLNLTDATAAAGRDVPVSFVINGPDGAPVTRYETSHEKKLHLIAVRRDMAGFQHVHPRLSAEGTWSVPLDLSAGEWRVYADFTAEGAQPLTLGTDLSVPGTYQPAQPLQPSGTARVDDYTVTLDGRLTPGRDSRLRFTISKGGEPVTDLQPYLGAFGHLVALRDGDLAYLHVHPAGTPSDGVTEPGPGVVFYAAVPSPGSYRLFLDFQHQGKVRTVAFAANTTESPEPAGARGGHSDGGSHSDH